MSTKTHAFESDPMVKYIRPYGQRKNRPLVKCRRVLRDTVQAHDYVRNANGKWVNRPDFEGQPTALFECVLRPCGHK